jgi:hypothetical protein
MKGTPLSRHDLRHDTTVLRDPEIWKELRSQDKISGMIQELRDPEIWKELRSQNTISGMIQEF